MLIWDEAPMAHKYCFESVDRLFKDVLKSKYKIANISNSFKICFDIHIIYKK
jgi:hypothetical protein